MADDILKEALEAFDLAAEAEADNRANALEDMKFARLGEQWPAKVMQQRELEGRPCLTINKLLPVIRQVVNDARQNRPSIAVHPVDSQADPETAKVITGMVRSIEQSSDADVAYDTAIDCAVSGGFGYWTINLDYACGNMRVEDLQQYGVLAFEKDIFIRRVANPFTVYGDPHSDAADSSDWMQAHLVETLTRAQFKAKYKGAKESDFGSAIWAKVAAPWMESDSVQVAAYWKREKVVKNALAVNTGEDVVFVMEDDFDGQGEVIGRPRPIIDYKVTQHIVSGVETLESNEWAGSYIPIVPVYGDEVNVEGKRHFRSLTRDARDPQRMFNYWRTTATELVALAPRAPFIGRKGAFETDAAKWATANTASHAYIEFDGPEAPRREPFAGVPAGVLQQAMDAADDIKAVTGIYDASLGARSNETSGRAIMARQREGDVSTFHFIDNQTRAIRHTGRIILDLIPKVYNDERIARIMGEDGSTESKPINREFTEGEGENAVLRMHDVRVGRYDVVVKAGPSYTSRREEARLEMIELIRSYPEAAPVIGDILARNFDWPGAEDIAERLEKLLPPSIKDEDGALPPEVQGQLQQMGEAIQVLGQKLQEAEGKRDIEAEKLAIERYKAETERMTALQPEFGPQEIQAMVLQTLQQLASPDELQNEGESTGMELAA